MVRHLWSGNNEDAVTNTYRLLATVCHDWWSLLRQPAVRRSLRSAFRSTGTTIYRLLVSVLVHVLVLLLVLLVLIVLLLYLLFVFEFSVLLEDSRSCLTLVFHLFWTSFRFIFPADKHPVSFFLFLFSLKSGFTDMIVAIIVFFSAHCTALFDLSLSHSVSKHLLSYRRYDDTETSNACVVLVPYLYQLGVIW